MYIESNNQIGYNIQVNILADSIIRLNNYAIYHPKSTWLLKPIQSRHNIIESSLNQLQ